VVVMSGAFGSALLARAMPAVGSGASSPLSVSALARGWRARGWRHSHYTDSPGVFACRAATVTSGVNPPERR